MKFNSCYYLAKRERPFANYPHLLELQKKNDVKQIGKSYATGRAAGIFTDYIVQVYKNPLQEDLVKAVLFGTI